MHKDDFFLKLSWAFSGSGFDSIYDLEVPENVYTSLIYNTNDLCLNKAQFGVLMEFLRKSFNRFLIISLDVLICRYSPLFRAFPALFISEEPHKSFYYPLCFRSQK